MAWTVYFNLNGAGSDVPSQTVPDGGVATQPADPTREGHRFDAWYKDASCETQYDFKTPVTSDLTLYAGWCEVPTGAMIEGVLDEHIQAFEIEESVISNEMAVGSFNQTIVTIKLINPNKSYDGLKGTWIKTYWGRLYVYEAASKQGEASIELKCYDLAHAFDKTYDAVLFTFPCTILEWAQNVCQACGVELGSTSFPNASVMLDEQPYLSEGASYRDAIREITGAAGAFAQIINNKLYIHWFSDVVTESPGWIELTQEDEVPAVTTLVLGRGSVEDNIVYPTPEEGEETHELRIDDNQILFNREREMAVPIYNAVVGFAYRIFDLRTVGIGKFRAGQRISYTDLDNETQVSYTMTHILKFLGGDYKDARNYESRISTTQLKETNTNYSYAGSIYKTVKETSVAVNKNTQQITALVSSQEQMGNEMNENFSSVNQTISSVITSIQNSGGNNLIKNSAMYIKDNNGVPAAWAFAGLGSYSTDASADAQANGSLSGQIISLRGERISQIVTVKADNDSIPEVNKTYYSFSCRIKKLSSGTCSVKLTDGTEEGVWTIEIGDNESSNYGEFAIEGILPHSTELTVTVEATSDAEFSITDMMLATGTYRSQWTQANGEFSNAQVQITIDGIAVKNNNQEGTYTRLTSQQAEIYKNNRLAAVVSSEKITADQASFNKEIDIDPIKMVSQTDGLAFVEKEN